MSEYKIAGTFDVYDNADFILDDFADDVSIMVSEDNDGMFSDDAVALTVSESDDVDFNIGKTITVEESEIDYMLPGSDLAWTPPEEELAKDTNWADDSDHAHFTNYLKDKLSKVPRHSGEKIPGCERASAFLKSLDAEISKAMRSDLDGKVDENEIDCLRQEIEKGIDRLDSQIKKLRGNRKSAATEVRLVSTGECKKCASITPLWHDIKNDTVVCLHCDAQEKTEDGLAKEANTPILNVYMTPFERAITSTIINSKVSAGRNIEETYELMKNKYNFTPREELAFQQLVADYGYPIIKDRGRLNEESDAASGDSVDWNTQYHA